MQTQDRLFTFIQKARHLTSSHHHSPNLNKTLVEFGRKEIAFKLHRIHKMSLKIKLGGMLLLLFKTHLFGLLAR